MSRDESMVWSEEEQRELDALFAADYPATPPLTRRGVEHHVVEVDGYQSNYRNIMRGWPLIVGRTRCGKSGLLMDRTTVGVFDRCRRCYPT